MNMMLFERKFETRSRGLICGVGTIAALESVRQPIIQKRGKLILADTKPLFTNWQPWTKHWKVVIRAREGGEIIWQRPFATEQEALFSYVAATGLHLEPGKTYHLPPVWIDGELEIKLALVATYNSSNSTASDWPSGNLVPAGIKEADYLVVGGGASGGADIGGGGGAGDIKTGTQTGLTPGGAVTITVGAGGASVGGTTTGNNGSASTVFSVTANGGGRGGGTSNVSATGGSGGGGNTTTSGSSGTGTNVNSGGAGLENGDTYTGGGGGGAGGAGSASTSTLAGAGGAGLVSSLSGISVTYAAGGGGGFLKLSGTTTSARGIGGSSIGGNGAVNSNTTQINTATSGTANTGSGGGGGAWNGGSPPNALSGAGGDGVIVLSWGLGGCVPVTLPMGC